MNKKYIKSLIGLSVMAVLFITGMVLVKSQVAAHIDTAEISDKGFVMGNPDSDVQIVEYSNFECPFCQENNQNLHETLKELVEKNEILYIWKPITLEKFPLGNEAVHFIDPNIGDTDLLENIRVIFENTSDWDENDSEALQEEMNETLKLKRHDHSGLQRLLDDEAEAAGIQSTPTIIINDQAFTGILTKEKLSDVINTIKNE
ncbi:thioredoxin domain-containing protein [Rossellomorea vietnamensis]|uniref:Thioredoxin domain-containing protein n=1 Tax=Rossellomorea vietnamensis TaxID=218284 RepID=A0A5D4K9S9_9BACI|nr:thioredoxin domain-containing protein [Rossellomorea vietnamensis]TYR73470.1 thioredoxin domain-containing protein [Rossellomorea vietnamensis]